MNIFVLDTNPQLAAQYHCDKHVVKMITESCQMLSTYINNHHKDLAKKFEFYKSTHIHHPCNIWLTESKANVWWLMELTGCLLEEYNFRYNKPANFKKAWDIYFYTKGYFITKKLGNKTPFKLCMPEHCIIDNDPVLSYRNLYKTDKAHLIKYTKRNKPEWL